MAGEHPDEFFVFGEDDGERDKGDFDIVGGVVDEGIDADASGERAIWEDDFYGDRGAIFVGGEGDIGFAEFFGEVILEDGDGVGIGVGDGAGFAEFFQGFDAIEQADFLGDLFVNGVGEVGIVGCFGEDFLEEREELGFVECFGFHGE